MNTEELSLSLGVNVSTNVMRPGRGDLLVITVDQYLTPEQRNRFESKLKPMFAELGCKMVVLEGGADVLLVKKVALESEVSTASANERLETVEKTASRVRDELQHAAS